MKKNEFLEKLRKNLGYSRKKIGEYLEVSPTTIERYEKGKVDFTYKTKYVLGICALAGYDNEIFEYENINEYENTYKISLFSSKIREILYFLDIPYEEYNIYILNLLKRKYNLSFFTKFFLNEIHNNIISQNIDDLKVLENFYFKEIKKEYDFVNDEKFINDLIKAQIENLHFAFFIQILLLATFNFFNIKNFYTTKELLEIKKIISNIYNFLNCITDLNTKEYSLSYVIEDEFHNDISILKNLFPTIKQTIEELMIKGKPVNKETIKEFKIELETGAILSTCNQPTDPKDKQICELLQYAPPAFKDKIIEKLLQYKKDIEEL